MDNIFIGQIVLIDETEEISNSFQKRQFVLDDMADEYPQQVPFELIQDRVAQIDGFIVGDIVTVKYNIRGREWNGRYFVNLQAWHVQINKRDSVRQEDASSNENLSIDNDIDSIDDIPF